MPSHIVIKKNGMYELVPSDADFASAQSKSDVEKVKNKLSDKDLGDVLSRILSRLEALEAKAA